MRDASTNQEPNVVSEQSFCVTKHSRFFRRCDIKRAREIGLRNTITPSTMTAKSSAASTAVNVQRLPWNNVARSASLPRDVARRPGSTALLVTVQALLGHSSPEITRPICLHAISEEQHKAGKASRNFFLEPKGFKFRNLRKGQIGNCSKLQEKLVDVTGFEPATPCLQSRCSPS